MKLITEFIFSDDGRIACDKCGQFTWQRDLSMIGKDFVCQSCANDLNEGLDEIKQILKMGE